MSTIVGVHGRQILDSRGNPTVEVDVTLADGIVRHGGRSFRGPARVPTDAWELRDGEPDKFLGKGVMKAIDNINGELAEALIGMDAMDQTAVDNRMRELDGTENKSNLGANAILGVSLANARAAADYAGLPTVPLSRRCRGPRPASPNDEYRERRRARR